MIIRMKFEMESSEGRKEEFPLVVRAGSNCLFSFALNCTRSRRIPASASTNQNPQKSDLIPLWRLVTGCVNLALVFRSKILCKLFPPRWAAKLQTTFEVMHPYREREREREREGEGECVWESERVRESVCVWERAGNDFVEAACQLIWYEKGIKLKSLW